MEETTVKLQIRESVSVVPVKPDELNIITSKSIFNLVGEEVENIVYPMLQMINDKYSLKKILEAFFEKEILNEKVYEVINKLEKYGIISCDNHKNEELLLQNSFCAERTEGNKIVEILKDKKVGILTNSDITNEISEYFDKAGIRNVISMNIESNLDFFSNDRELDFVFFYQNSDDLVNKNIVNDFCIKHNIPYIYVYSCGFEMKIGPLVVPYKTSCLECYEKRLESNLIYAEERKNWYDYALHNQEHTGNDEKVAFVDTMAICWGIAESVKFLIKDFTWMFPETIETEIYFNMFNSMHRKDRILKNPRCKCCAPQNRKKPTVRAWMEIHNYQSKGGV